MQGGKTSFGELDGPAWCSESRATTPHAPFMKCDELVSNQMGRIADALERIADALQGGAIERLSEAIQAHACMVAPTEPEKRPATIEELKFQWLGTWWPPRIAPGIALHSVAEFVMERPYLNLEQALWESKVCKGVGPLKWKLIREAYSAWVASKHPAA